MEEKTKKILIVDDDEKVRTDYAKAFEDGGFEVIESSDGLDGLASAISLSPDIIFTGIIMPRMDGFTFMQELKKNAKTSKIPVVISSHLGREEDRKKADELGAQDFFIKDSQSPQEVVQKVEFILKKHIYVLKFSEEKLDGKRLIEEIEKEGSDKMKKCSQEAMMRIKIYDFKDGEFIGKLICPGD